MCAAGYSNGDIYFIHQPGAKASKDDSQQKAITCVSFSEDGNWCLALDMAGFYILWNTSDIMNSSKSPVRRSARQSSDRVVPLKHVIWRTHLGAKAARTKAYPSVMGSMGAVHNQGKKQNNVQK